MDDTEQPIVIPIGTLEGFDKEAANRGLAASFKATAKIARACACCLYSFKEGNDLVCRINPPQVTFLPVPQMTVVQTPQGPRQQQTMAITSFTGFPIMRPD